jgi:RNA-directed DNA polymerase
VEQDTVSAVPERARQGTETRDRKWWWAEDSVWTERMVSALENGVKGGKWFSLVDKLTRPATLEAAWRKVARNKGSAGVDGQSTERFARQAERYLDELWSSLEDDSYRPQPVKRVEIPKGDGRTRPLGIPTWRA